MNQTQHRKRRPSVWMPGHALVLAFRQRSYDQTSAHNMTSYLRLRDQVTPEARMRLLSGLAGGDQ